MFLPCVPAADLLQNERTRERLPGQRHLPRPPARRLLRLARVLFLLRQLDGIFDCLHIVLVSILISSS